MNTLSVFKQKVTFEFVFFFQTESQIFPPTTGGGEKLSKDTDLPFLGHVPIDPRIGKYEILFQCKKNQPFFTNRKSCGEKVSPVKLFADKINLGMLSCSQKGH